MKQYRAWLRKTISSIPGKKLKVLDVGCWMKQYQPLFGDRCGNYVGLDVSAGPHVDVVGDVHRLPFKASSFDVVLCLEVLEHVERPWVAVEEIRRVLKPGGHLIASAPFIFPFHPCPIDCWRFTSQGWSVLLQKYEDVKIERIGNSTTTFILFPTLYAGRLPKEFWPLKGIVYTAANILDAVLRPYLDNGAFTIFYAVSARKGGGEYSRKARKASRPSPTTQR